MTRLEKCEIAKSMGFVYNPETGLVHNKFGREVGHIRKDGYIELNGGKHFGYILLHHYAWYSVYGNVDFKELDHINRIKTDNRISNLRIVTRQENTFNTNAKGYYWITKKKKYNTQIRINGKLISGGYFDTEEQAREKYLELKKIYHQL